MEKLLLLSLFLLSCHIREPKKDIIVEGVLTNFIVKDLNVNMVVLGIMPAFIVAPTEAVQIDVSKGDIASLKIVEKEYKLDGDTDLNPYYPYELRDTSFNSGYIVYTKRYYVTLPSCSKFMHNEKYVIRRFNTNSSVLLGLVYFSSSSETKYASDNSIISTCIFNFELNR